MSMVLPKLWSSSNRVTLHITLTNLSKYKNLINWKNEESILEFGFANGSNSALTLQPLLPKDYKEFIATEVSKEMIEDAAKTNWSLPRSKILQMDITADIDKEFHNRFDHVFGFMVIHMVKKPRKAFENIYRMLKPGGSTFLLFLETIPSDDMFDRLSRHPKWSKYGQEEMISTYYFNENPSEEYKNDLDRASFKNYVFEVEKGSYRFASLEECNNFHIAINSTIPRIPKEELEEYKTDYLKEIERCHSYDISYENGKRIVTNNHSCCVVFASKT